MVPGRSYRSIALRIAALCFLALTVSHGAVRAVGTEPPLPPLTLGEESISDVIVTSAEGRVQRGLIIRKLTEEVSLGGKSYFRRHTWSDAIKRINAVDLVRQTKSGFYVINEQNPAAGEQRLVAFPLREGASWQWMERGSPVSSMLVGKERIVVNGRVYYNAYHFHCVGERYTEDYWAVRDLGVIYSHTVERDGRRTIVALRDYKANP